MNILACRMLHLYMWPAFKEFYFQWKTDIKLSTKAWKVVVWKIHMVWSEQSLTEQVTGKTAAGAACQLPRGVDLSEHWLQSWGTGWLAGGEQGEGTISESVLQTKVKPLDLIPMEDTQEFWVNTELYPIREISCGFPQNSYTHCVKNDLRGEWLV